MQTNIAKRIEGLDWAGLSRSLWEDGYALTPPILSPDECSQLIASYSDDDLFRSHIVMARYRFGLGDYKYFKYPLPEIVQELRECSYPHLAPVASEWNKALGIANAYPVSLPAYLKECHKRGQSRPTPLLLHYEAGGYNCLHQDLYGEMAFPFQMTFFLSEPAKDFEGGEFVLVEQVPRAQSKAHVIAPGQGQAMIFTTRYRPVKGARGYYRANIKHGVSKIRSGRRYTLGVIFHDAE
jgi:uncharacterized protein